MYNKHYQNDEVTNTKNNILTTAFMISNTHKWLSDSLPHVIFMDYKFLGFIILFHSATLFGFWLKKDLTKERI